MNNSFFKGYEQFVNWTAKELISLKKCSIQNDINKVNSKINYILSSTQFWIYCYIFCIDSTNKYEKLHIINLDFFKKLSKTINQGSFQFSFIRKTKLLLKRHYNFDFLTIENIQDKIVLKGLIAILEQLLKHCFFKNKLGFERGKYCHDVLQFIRKKGLSAVWAIEGDISKCFNHFNYKKLISLVKKKYANLQMFVDLLYKALKTKIIFLNRFYIDKNSILQSFLLNSILCNIYLHELDTFIEKSLLLHAFRNKKQSIKNSKFNYYTRFYGNKLTKADKIKSFEKKLKCGKPIQKMRKNKLKTVNKCNIYKLIYKKFLYCNLTYVRFLNNFIIFVSGTFNDSIQVQETLNKFLKRDLALNVFQEKQKIIFLKKQKVNFLGFQFKQSSDKFLFYKKTCKMNQNLKFYGLLATWVSKLKVTFNMNTILQKLADKGLIKFKTQKFFPTSYKALLQYNTVNIINYLKTVFSKLVNYYKMADNWYDAKTLYNYFGLFCTAMTIAHKTKNKITKVFNKYKVDLKIINKSGKILAVFGFFNNSILKKKINTIYKSMPALNPEQLLKKYLQVNKKLLVKTSF